MKNNGQQEFDTASFQRDSNETQKNTTNSSIENGRKKPFRDEKSSRQM